MANSLIHYPGIIPPYLLAHIAGLDDDTFATAAVAAQRALVVDPAIRAARASATSTAPRNVIRGVLPPAGAVLSRAIYDAGQRENLPGNLVRAEGDGPTGDLAVDEAYEGLGATHALFADVFERDSIDGAGMPLEAIVHFDRLYDNAFWDGTRMVFGDGDGEIFTRFTASLSVIGHELAHGVTQFTAGFEYEGQSGALNESVSDVFGVLVEQYLLGQSADEASWLVGVGLFTDQVEGEALRSLRAPGTAYDDDVLGQDPQPAHMDDYIETDDDNGGVHLNSGIPNRAFYECATALGGSAWDVAGRIWYDTLLAQPGERVDFAGFAAATIAAASERYGGDSSEVDAVRGGWAAVGVDPVPATAADAAPDGGSSGEFRY